MKKSALLGVALVLALPAVGHAQQRMTEPELIQLATDRGVCGDRTVASARYVNDTDNRVVVTCGDEPTGLVPVAGLGLAGAGAAAALGLAAVAAGGGGGATPDTQ